MRRAETVEAPPEPTLTHRQHEILALVERVYEATGEPVSASYVCRRLGLKHHEAVRGHFEALYRKGWLETETSPATPKRWLDR